MSPDFPTRPIPSSGPAAPVARTDRNPWNWLLLIPITLPLLTFVYNRETPTLFGFPFFFWFQLLFAPLALLMIDPHSPFKGVPIMGLFVLVSVLIAAPITNRAGTKCVARKRFESRSRIDV